MQVSETRSSTFPRYLERMNEEKREGRREAGLLLPAFPPALETSLPKKKTVQFDLMLS
jgi:hypothetical protein